MERWGLVLSGGGGKGAYEAGALRALQQLGILQNVSDISGASVGALNAILAAMRDGEKACEIWNKITPVMMMDYAELDALIEHHSIFEEDFADHVKSQMLDQGICSREGLIKIIDSEVDLESVLNGSIFIYVNITRCPADEVRDMMLGESQGVIEQATWIEEQGYGYSVLLNRLDANTAKDVLLASSAMPFIYEPVAIDGHFYRDGGLWENVPLSAMKLTGVDKLIVIRLDPNDRLDEAVLRDFDEVIDLHPSKDIGSLLDGTLDFSKEGIRFRTALGYYDTLRMMSYHQKRRLGIEISDEQRLRDEAADFDKARAMNRVSELEDRMNQLIDKLNSY